MSTEQKPPDRLQKWDEGIAPYLRAHHCPGVAWLAGFPRSGAALVRTVLANCFNQFTGSIYTENGLTPVYASALKVLPSDTELSQMRIVARQQRTLFVKTHQSIDRPEGLPTLVIVRDARRVFSSLGAFFRQRMEMCFTAEEVIAGHTPWGDWTEWVTSWLRWGPRNALWLRYEDIRADLPRAVERIARHFGIEPVKCELPDFKELHAGNPTIFRSGENAGNGGLTEEQEDYFWALHGAAMNALGYYRE